MRFSPLIAPCVLVSIVAGCSSGGGDTSSADSGGAADAPPADTAAPDTGAGDGSGADSSGDAAADGAEDAATEVEAREYPADPPEVFGGERPAPIHVPSAYTPERAWPLVVVLHGFGATGAVQDIFLGVSALADEFGVLVIAPDGTENSRGQQFWNATPACCSFGVSSVDDVGYLVGLVEEIAQSYHVDEDRVFTFGHSNGGFMSYRLACEASGTFAAIASLAGATFADAEPCEPASEPVSVLQIHGTNDDTIRYDGGTFGGEILYPSAARTVERHARLLGCTGEPVEAAAALDVEMGIDGAETVAIEYREGCAPGTAAALWTIPDGSHIPVLNPDGTRLVLEWLLAHGRGG